MAGGVIGEIEIALEVGRRGAGPPEFQALRKPTT